MDRELREWRDDTDNHNNEKRFWRVRMLRTLADLNFLAVAMEGCDWRRPMQVNSSERAA